MFTMCPDCTTKPLDICFLLDSSGSITEKGAGNWDFVTSFVNNFIENFEIGPAETRVGLVTFSNQAAIRIGLNTTFDKDRLKELTQNPSFYDGGMTNMQVYILLLQ